MGSKSDITEIRPKAMQTNATRLLYAGIAVILLSAAFFLGYSNGRQGDGLASGLGGICPDRYQEGYDAAHQKLLDSGVLGQVEDKTSAIGGAATAVNGDVLTITSTAAATDPLADPLPTERTIKVTEATRISVRTVKTPEELIKDAKAFNSALSKPNEIPPTPPLPYKESAGKLSDIAVGDTIEVTSADGADILRSAEIVSPASIVVTKPAQ